jgi:16S rRNA (cytosine967-C5)-methyltransferase
MDGVKDFAACDETVSLCKIKPLKGFVNAVLRQITANKDTLELPRGDSAAALSVQLSVPTPLIAYLSKQYSVNEIRDIFYSNESPTYTIRCNSLKDIDQAAIIDQLQEDGCDVAVSPYVPNMLRINKLWSRKFTQLYQDGIISIQGEASALAASAINVRAGQKILDLCSAPGGKTMLMAEAMNNDGHIVAQDIHAHRVELIKEQAQRLGITCVECVVADGTIENEAYVNQFDAVLIDAPCTGLGVTNSKPEIKYRITEESIQKTCEIQQGLLSTAAKYVKKDGILVYSTCTVNKAENDWIIESFQQKNKSFEWEPFDYHENQPFRIHPAMVQTLTGRDGVDGFFIARLRKVK